MAMPEAALHQYDLSVLRKNYVWVAWEFLDVQSKPISEPMQQGSDGQFRFRILRANTGH
jgi:hypothetical protein